MVNNQRTITHSPQYDLQTVKLAIAGRKFEFVTRKARNDVRNFGWNSEHIIQLFAALQAKHYDRSSFPNQSEIGNLYCDQYVIKIIELDRQDDYIEGSPLIREASRHDDSHDIQEIFLKFALEFDAEDSQVPIVSIHLASY